VPTYQYACTACGHQLEAVQSFSDEPLAECPVCEGRLRKLFSSVGIVFKGSGFYRTDSRANGNSASEAARSDAKSGDGKSGDAKSDGKSGDAKSDGKSGDSKPASKPAQTAATKSESASKPATSSASAS
jgi:putative FmdB family regulatory protein